MASANSPTELFASNGAALLVKALLRGTFSSDLPPGLEVLKREGMSLLSGSLHWACSY
jgi:hypothetical protein